MKGIILAGGAGTRLYPASLAISKILLPIYDKPMIYYPLATLLSAGIRDVLVITNPEDHENFKRVLGDGSRWGVQLSYTVQYEKRGIADAFLLGETFLAGQPCALILGDNIFYGNGWEKLLLQPAARREGATVFACEVDDPCRFGVVEFDAKGKAVSLEEKPTAPKSRFAVTGLYFYDERVVQYARRLTPSARGELEITDLNKLYLQDGLLHAARLERGFVWMDAGTHQSMLQAANFVRSMHLQGTEIACLEEIALRKGFVTKETLRKNAAQWPDNPYYRHILELTR